MKNLLVYMSCLAVLIAGDVITRTSPRMTCGLLNVQLNSDSILVCILGANVVFRKQAVLNQTLPLAGGATIELAASTLGACAKLVAKAGLTAFEFNTKCLAYNSSICFKKCDTSCDRFIFVTSNSCSKEPRLVPFDEAPWKPGPYDDTREYRLEKLIYLNESNMPEPWGAGETYDPVSDRIGYSYATLQNETTFSFTHSDVDLSTCLFYDGDAGLPTLVSSIYYNYTLVIFHFMDSCGDTIRLPPRANIDNLALWNAIMLYSHRGYGCSEFPGKTYVNCTVNFVYDDWFTINSVSRGLNGPDGGCAGFTLTENSTGVERDICGRTENPGLPRDGGSLALTLQGSAPDPRLGFYAALGYW